MKTGEEHQGAPGAPEPVPISIEGAADPAEVEAGREIRALVGEAGWRRLRPAIRERFGHAPKAGDTWLLRGVMSEVSATRVGRLMAWASRLFGGPVTHLTGRDVPVDVYVYEDMVLGGTVWERRYDFGRPKRAVARTTKRMDASGRLLECFGLGLGMELEVYEERGALNFRSRRFYADLMGRRIRFPYLLSPGTLLVEHIDEGNGLFRFRMTVNHPIFGRVFFQDGIFQKLEVNDGTRA